MGLKEHIQNWLNRVEQRISDLEKELSFLKTEVEKGREFLKNAEENKDTPDVLI